MFDSVLYARDKWLREGGILLPDRAKMYIAIIDDEAYYKKKLVISPGESKAGPASRNQDLLTLHQDLNYAI